MEDDNRKPLSWRRKKMKTKEGLEDSCSKKKVRLKDWNIIEVTSISSTKKGIIKI
jgi:hypothetical protein